MARRCGDPCRGDAALSAFRHPYAYATRSRAAFQYFLVTEIPGPDWNRSRPRREQLGWDAHAAFLDSLADQGAVASADQSATPDVDPPIRRQSLRSFY
jgi:hypothetical protein